MSRFEKFNNRYEEAFYSILYFFLTMQSKKVKNKSYYKDSSSQVLEYNVFLKKF